MRRDTAIAGTLVFTAVLPALVAVLIPGWIAGWQLRATGPWLVVAVSLMGIGVGVYAICATGFAREGRGTPAPVAPPSRFVASALYRYSRNPMYVGWVIFLIGSAVLYGSWRVLAYAGVFFVAANLFVIFYEEPALRRKFGAEYVEYCRRVGRWV